MVAPSMASFIRSIHLCFGDAKPVGPSYLEVHIKASRMDPFHKVMFIYLGVTQTGSVW